MAGEGAGFDVGADGSAAAGLISQSILGWRGLDMHCALIHQYLRARGFCDTPRCSEKSRGRGSFTAMVRDPSGSLEFYA